MSVLETVQETLFQQFLAGSDPSRRLAETQGTQGTQEQQSTRVEDLPWWKYQRALALWYCEWLDTYYDSGERRFLWRDELTQGFDAADLTEVKDLAMRMRLELPDHDAEIPDASSDVQAQKLKESSEGPGDAVEDDGNWHVAALAAAVEDDEELLWQEDGQGNLTHWAAEVGRLFLWQEHSGVLYEYVPASDTRNFPQPGPKFRPLGGALGVDASAGRLCVCGASGGGRRPWLVAGLRGALLAVLLPAAAARQSLPQRTALVGRGVG